MKYIPFLFFVLACNDAAKEQQKPSAAQTAVKSSTVSNSDCSFFFWFQKGAVAEFAETGGGGEKALRSSITVNDVTNEGTATIAQSTMKYGNKELKTRYKCEDGKIMMDLRSLLSNNMMKDGGMEMELSGDGWISFPLDMKTGDVLEGTPFIMTAKKDGNTVMTMKSETKSRSVGAAEKITTPAGSWEAFRVSEIRTMTMEMPAMKGRSMPAQQMKYDYWFVPRFGIVRTEISGGGVTHRSELVSLSK